MSKPVPGIVGRLRDDFKRTNQSVEPKSKRFLIQERREAASHIERLVAVVEQADAAIAEMSRYFDGGETRGSYDGRPERDQLRKAGYATRAALSLIKEQGK